MILEIFLASGLAYLQVPHQHEHPPRSAEAYARHLEDPSRDAWQKPHEVMQALNIRPQEVIADLALFPPWLLRRIIGSFSAQSLVFEVRT
jgi:hypothetical protein